MSDPGGLRGAGLVALWTVPWAVLAVFAWFRSERATAVLEFLTAAVVVLAVWFALDPGGWRSFENAHGPVRAIGVFALMLPLALLGWRRPRVAGWMLLIVGLVPVLAASVSRGAGHASMMAVGAPAAIDGILYLLSSVLVIRRRKSPAIPG
ncbi:MAG: hypothetical protein ABSC36_02395 [Gaiellaceae bacterium]